MAQYRIVFYSKEDGSVPVSDFLDSLNEKQLAKSLRDIDLLEENGPALREPQSKQLEANLFELRTKAGTNISRILYFFLVGKTIVLTNGFVKKQNHTPESEKERARRYRADYIRRFVNHGL